MISVVFEGPSTDASRTTVQEVEVPRPGPGELSVDVESAGINFVDLLARRGDTGYVPAWPFRPGLEVAGTVRAVGSPEGAFEVGDRVAAFTQGAGLAEVAICRESLTVLVPPEVPSWVAAAAPLTLSTAMLLLQEAGRLAHGESVLMHAAGGGIGGAVAQIARALGAGELVGTVGSARKIASAKASGWDRVVVRRDILDNPPQPTPLGSFDLILDPLGTEMLAFELEHAAPGGRLVVFGNPGGAGLGPLPRIDQLMARNVSVGGFSIRRFSQAEPRRVARAMRDTMTMVGSGTVEVAVQRVHSLAGVAAVHDQLASGDTSGKYVVDINSSQTPRES